MTKNSPTVPPLAGLSPTHPGEILRETVLPALDRSKTEFAAALGISRRTLYDILDEKQGVTAKVALRLGRVLGNGAEIWMNLQAQHDLAKARQDIGAEVAQLPSWAEAS